MNQQVHESTTLSQLLKETVRQFPDQESYVGPDGRRTWTQTLENSKAIAKALLALDVQKGDHVGILLGNGSQWIEIFFACATVGAVTVPINTRFKAKELEYCLAQSDVKVLFFSDRFLNIDFAGMIKEVEPAVDAHLPGTALPLLRHCICVSPQSELKGAISWRDFLHQGESVDLSLLQLQSECVLPQDVLLIQFTSGTTAYPKGVMLSHSNMLLNARAVAERMRVKSRDRYFSIRPYFHVAGSTLSILVSLQTGCCLLTLPKFDVKENLKVLHEEKCTLISGNDTIFLSLMGHEDFDVSRLYLTGGWAAVDPGVMQKIHDEMGIKTICNAYGQSEASPNVLFSDCEEPFDLRKSGFATPLPGVQVRLANPLSDQPVLYPGTGEIQVKGWNVMKGYYKMPQETAKAFTQDGWLKTGDLGESDGMQRVRMVGRLKDIFRVGGENVAPSDVEEILHAHPGVQQAQVVGVPDQKLGEVCAAFVIASEEESVGVDELIAWCKDRCANFKVPKYLAFVDSFEDIGMTGSSKVQKNKLRDHAIEIWQLQVRTSSNL
jgi:fatty-acyl-CoA synthase